ncbi:DUF2267 domain-containing protein [Salinisphaera sp. SPP-AMP-43]|uniref:DUF2267 domain-containing protein n=1 Tax=Salinisphaera sp. SPP-AMP-43 TaxID=3121288 RepID=UPI003C6E4917
MPELGLATIDKSVQETNRWLAALMQSMGTDDKQYAYQGLRAVLIALRDRLPLDLGANLGDQLPLFVRGMYYENYVPAEVPQKYRKASDWIQAVAHLAANMDETEADRVSRAVFAVLEQALDPGMIDKLGEALPDDVCGLLEI